LSSGDSTEHGFIVRISDKSEIWIYARRFLYVGIERKWAAGSRLVFVKKITSNDVFMGSGTVDQIQDLGFLQKDEAAMCQKNGWHKKIIFKRLARYLPAIPLCGSSSQFLSFLIYNRTDSKSQTKTQQDQNIPLHGLPITHADILKIEGLAKAIIIS